MLIARYSLHEVFVCPSESFHHSLMHFSDHSWRMCSWTLLASPARHPLMLTYVVMSNWATHEQEQILAKLSNKVKHWEGNGCRT